MNRIFSIFLILFLYSQSTLVHAERVSLRPMFYPVEASLRGSSMVDLVRKMKECPSRDKLDCANWAVNTSMVYTDDQEAWGEVALNKYGNYDFWATPNEIASNGGRDDCEGFATTKYFLLLDSYKWDPPTTGFPKIAYVHSDKMQSNSKQTNAPLGSRESSLTEAATYTPHMVLFWFSGASDTNPMVLDNEMREVLPLDLHPYIKKVVFMFDEKGVYTSSPPYRNRGGVVMIEIWDSLLTRYRAGL